MLPSLNANGLLPPGIHRGTLQEVKRMFGQGESRHKLFLGLAQALESLAKAGVKTVYIDGSFVSDKINPRDVDGCWEGIDQVDEMVLDPVFLDFQASRKAMKEKYGVDFFPAEWKERSSGFPFLEFFQTSRDGERKGVVKISLGEEGAGDKHD